MLKWVSIIGVTETLNSSDASRFKLVEVSIYHRGDRAAQAETKLELVESLSQTLIWDEYLPTRVTETK